jgi:hypothetical protein
MLAFDELGPAKKKAFDELVEGNSYNSLYNSPETNRKKKKKEEKNSQQLAATLVALYLPPCDAQAQPCLMGPWLQLFVRPPPRRTTVVQGRRPGILQPRRRSHTAQQPRLPQSINDFKQCLKKIATLALPPPTPTEFGFSLKGTLAFVVWEGRGSTTTVMNIVSLLSYDWNRDRARKFTLEEPIKQINQIKYIALMFLNLYSFYNFPLLI